MLLMGGDAHPNNWERELKKQDSVIVDIIFEDLKNKLKDKYEEFPWAKFEEEFEGRITEAIKEAQQENIMDIIQWEIENGDEQVGLEMFTKYLGTNLKKGRIRNEQNRSKDRLEKRLFKRKKKEESKKEKLGKKFDALLDELERSLKKEQTQNLFGSQLYF